MFGLGAQEMLLLVLLGVLLFGKRLPEVGRSLGKTVMEFKNGLRGMEDEFATAFRESDDSKPAIVSSNESRSNTDAAPAAPIQPTA
jgi:sec-independent protein translocase protein TatA